MPIHRTQPAPTMAQAASATGPVVLAGLPDPSRMVTDLVKAQQALGASWGEAVGMAASIYGEGAVTALLAARLTRMNQTKTLLGLLDGIAKAAPSLANATLATFLSSNRLQEWAAPGVYWKHQACSGLHLQGRAWIAFLPDNLKIDGDLDLRGCTGLTSLPCGLEVGDALNLAGCTALKSLPDNLKVGKDLWLRGCASWDGKIPQGVHVGGCVRTDRVAGLDLYAWRQCYPHGVGIMAHRIPSQGMSAPREAGEACGPLGEALDLAPAVACFVQAQMALGASWGEAAGMAAEVYGAAAITPLMERKLAGIQDGVDALLTLLGDIAKVTHVPGPDGWAHGANAGLANDWLNACLDPGRRVALGFGWRDHVMCPGREWIRTLPEGLWVGGNLSLAGCRSIQSLPGGLAVQGDMDLARCASLRNLPSDMKAGRDIFLNDCTALEALPESLRVHGHLNLRGCTSLKALPKGLHVRGWLDLEGCTALERLPEGLVVDGGVELRGCLAWDGQIPDDAQGLEVITTHDHPGGITLEEWRDLHRSHHGRA